MNRSSVKDVFYRIGLIALPFLLTALVYKCQSFYIHHFHDQILNRELFDLELKLFGISVNGEYVTPPHFVQSFTHPIFDLYAGFFYITYILLLVVWALAFEFYYFPKKHLGLKIALSFFVCNMLGYFTYTIFPAAPPWYGDLYGFGPIVLDAPASAAGALRVDEFLGFPLFQNFYAQSTNVFGALPSLHAAYPAVAVFFSFRMKTWRVASLIYLFSVSFAGVYLNHHYVVDVLLGWIYGFAASVLIEKVLLRRLRS